MLDTVAALVLALAAVQGWYTALPEWPSGRSWVLSVSASKLPDTILEANRPACCVWAHTADGKILRAGSLATSSSDDHLSLLV
jgi:hypothetical protein